MTDAPVGLEPALDARAPSDAESFPRRRRPIVDILAPAVLAAYVAVAFAPFAELFPLPGFAASVGVPLLGVGVLLLTPTDRIRRIPVSLPLVALIAWLAFTYAWSMNPEMTAFRIRAELLPILVVSLVVGTMRLRTIVSTLLVVVGVVVAWSLVLSIALPSARTAYNPGEDPQIGFHGSFGHKNHLGVFSVYGLALAAGFRRMRFARLVMVLCLFALVGTRSATAGAGLLAVAFGGALLAAFERQRTPRQRQFFAVAAGTSLLTAVLLVVGSLPTLLGLYGKDLTFSGRTKIWGAVIEAISDEPIRGYGLGAVWADEWAHLTRSIRADIGFDAAHAHNAAFELMLVGGVPALVIATVLLTSIVAAAVRLVGRTGMIGVGVGQWALMSIAAIVVMGVSEPLIEGPHLGLLAIIATAVSGASLLERRTRPQRSVL